MKYKYSLLCDLLAAIHRYEKWAKFFHFYVHFYFSLSDLLVYNPIIVIG